jgi:hypothetical protein
MRLGDDRVIATTAGALRAVAQTLLAHGRAANVLAFRLADTHLHALVACSRAEARHYAHYCAIALQARLRLGVPFEPTRVRPIVDQQHLYQAFRYVLRQNQHHRLASDPAHDGSSLPDLLGMRMVEPEHGRAVRMMLPRLDLRELAASLAVSFVADDAAPASLLAAAAAAAMGLPDLAGRSAACVVARRAAVHAAAKLPTGILSDELGASSRAIQRHRLDDVDARIVRAVALQWRFRASLVERGLWLP